VLAMRQEIVEKGFEIPGRLKKITDNIQSSGNIFGRKKHPQTLKDFSLPETGEDIFYSGCHATYLQPETALTNIKILKSAGLDIAHLGNKEGCCGEMLKQTGNMKRFKETAVLNVAKLKQAGAKRVIISCAHGYSTFKNDYTNPHVVGALPFEVIHITEMIASLLKKGRIRFSKNLNRTVTYHDPCFLGRQGGVYAQPREILEAVPGLTLKEMNRYGKWSYCCGAGGKVTLNAFPEMAKETAKERLLEAKAVADTLVTSCTTCLAHLKKTAQTEGIDIEIVDLSMLVATTMELSD
jgi:heterodisulfide reductase subunit D